MSISAKVTPCIFNTYPTQFSIFFIFNDATYINLNIIKKKKKEITKSVTKSHYLLLQNIEELVKNYKKQILKWNERKYVYVFGTYSLFEKHFYKPLNDFTSLVKKYTFFKQNIDIFCFS